MLVATTSRDKIAQHLIQQKARAVEQRPINFLGKEDATSRCQYRTSEGLMCAAGCIIPEAEYHPHMEGQTAFQLHDTFPSAFPKDITVRELELWQSYHDHTAVFGCTPYSYQQWIDGKEDHHPEKFKAAVANHLGWVESFEGTGEASTW